MFVIEEEIETIENCKWLTFGMFLFKICLNRSNFVSFASHFIFIFFFLIFYVLDSFAGGELKFKDSDSLAVCDSMPNKHETRLQFAKESFAELPEDEDKFEDGVD